MPRPGAEGTVVSQCFVAVSADSQFDRHFEAFKKETGLLFPELEVVSLADINQDFPDRLALVVVVLDGDAAKALTEATDTELEDKGLKFCHSNQLPPVLLVFFGEAPQQLREGTRERLERAGLIVGSMVPEEPTDMQSVVQKAGDQDYVADQGGRLMAPNQTSKPDRTGAEALGKDVAVQEPVLQQAVVQAAQILAAQNQLPVNKFLSLPETLVDMDDIGARLVNVMGVVDTSSKPLMLVLSGKAGIGKTTAARALFNKLHGSDMTALCHALHLDAAECSIPVKQKVMLFSLTCRAVDSIETSKQGKTRLLEALDDKRLLLLVDNVWSSNQLEELLPTGILSVLGKGSVILVTSRDNGVGHGFEGVINARVEEAQLQCLAEDPARELLCRHAYGTTAVVPAADKELLDALVQRCGGLPMALEVAGLHWRQVRSPAGPPTDHDAFLRAAYAWQRAGRLEATRTMFDALGASWGQLSAGEQEALLDIVHFLAVPVCGRLDQPEIQADPAGVPWHQVRLYCGEGEDGGSVLDRLGEHNLVQQINGGIQPVVGVHSTLADFGKLALRDQMLNRLELDANTNAQHYSIPALVQQLKGTQAMRLCGWQLDEDDCQALNQLNLRLLWLENKDAPLLSVDSLELKPARLKWLSLEGNGLPPLAAVMMPITLQLGTPNLCVLNLHNLSELQQLGGLAACAGLRSLSLGGCCQVTALDLDGLTGLVQLHVKSCERLHLHSITHVSSLQSLTSLQLSYCGELQQDAPIDVMRGIQQHVEKADSMLHALQLHYMASVKDKTLVTELKRPLAAADEDRRCQVFVCSGGATGHAVSAFLIDSFAKACPGISVASSQDVQKERPSDPAAVDQHLLDALVVVTIITPDFVSSTAALDELHQVLLVTQQNNGADLLPVWWDVDRSYGTQVFQQSLGSADPLARLGAADLLLLMSDARIAIRTNQARIVPAVFEDIVEQAASKLQRQGVAVLDMFRVPAEGLHLTPQLHSTTQASSSQSGKTQEHLPSQQDIPSTSTSAGSSAAGPSSSRLPTEPSGQLCHAFVVQAGREASPFGSFLVHSLKRSNPAIVVRTDQFTAPQSGTMAVDDCLADAFVVLVVITSQFLQDEAAANDLHGLFLNQAKLGSKRVLLPVYCGVTEEDVVRAIDGYYRDERSICDQWAKDLKTLSEVPHVTTSQGTFQLLDLVASAARAVVLHLAQMKKLPGLQLQPVPSTPVGLEAGARQLMEACQHDLEPRLVVLHGPEGIGKTSLACMFQNMLQDARPLLQIFFIKFEAYEGSADLRRKQRQLVAQLTHVRSAHNFPDVDSGRLLLRELLVDKCVLLVLDNARHEQVEELLPADLMQVLGPESVVLVTSRHADAADALATATGVCRKMVQPLSQLDARFLLHNMAYGPAADMLPESMAKLEDVLASCGNIPGKLARAAQAIKELPPRVSQPAATKQHSAATTAVSDRPLTATATNRQSTSFETVWEGLTEAERDLLLDVAVLLDGEPWHIVERCCQAVAASAWSVLTKHRHIYMDSIVNGNARLTQDAQQFCASMLQNKACHLELSTTTAPTLNKKGLEDLQGLKVSSCNISAALCSELAELSRLRSLHLQGWLVPQGTLSSLSVGWVLMQSPDDKDDSHPLATYTVKDMHALKVLVLHGLPQLSSVTLLGCSSLGSLHVQMCRRLHVLDLEGALSLKHLQVDTCDAFKGWARLPSSTQQAIVSGCPELTQLQFNGSTSLRSLELSYCAKLRDLVGLHSSSSLQEVNISNCDIQNFQLSKLSVLRQLDILGCPGPPQWEISNAHHLTKVSIVGCSELEQFVLQGLPHLSVLELGGFFKLSKLQVIDCFQLVSLVIRHIPCLSEFALRDVPNLQQLHVHNCKGLCAFSLPKLTALVELHLETCPVLNSIEGLDGIPAAGVKCQFDPHINAIVDQLKRAANYEWAPDDIYVEPSKKRIAQSFEASARTTSHVPTTSHVATILGPGLPGKVVGGIQDGWTSILAAARWGDGNAVQRLLQDGAAVDTTDTDGGTGTALHWACGRGHVQVVELLLAEHAPLEAIDRDGQTPLHRAANWGCSQAASVLLEAGASVLARDKDGWTPLHHAAYYGFSDVVESLLKEGASALATSKDGLRPSILARSNGQDVVANNLSQYERAAWELLQEHGEQGEEQDQKWWRQLWQSRPAVAHTRAEQLAAAAKPALLDQVCVSHAPADGAAEQFVSSILQPVLQMYGVRYLLSGFRDGPVGQAAKQDRLDSAANSQVFVAVVSEAYAHTFWPMAELDFAWNAHTQSEDAVTQSVQPVIVPVYLDASGDTVDPVSITRHWCDKQQEWGALFEPHLVDPQAWAANMDNMASMRIDGMEPLTDKGQDISQMANLAMQRIMELLPPSGISTAQGRAAGRLQVPDVFISHAGEQKLSVVDVMRARFADKHPELNVFVEEWSLKDGDMATARTGAACRGATVGVVLLSKEFVRNKYCMAELRILLARINQRDIAQQRARVPLLPVLYELTVDQLVHMRELYDSEPWCIAEPKPSPLALDIWAADLRAVAGYTMIRPDQWRGYSQLADIVLEQAVKLLEVDGRVPRVASGMDIHGFFTPPPAAELVGRQQELEKGLQALLTQRYVEIRGPPGEGKSTLAQHLIQKACSEWSQQAPVEGAGRQVVYALEVDMGELVRSQDIKAALAAKLLAMVGQPTAAAQWQELLGWLRRQAAVGLLFENAEEGFLSEVHNDAFASALYSLHALGNVHLVVPTRVEGPPITAADPEAAVVVLGCLTNDLGMRLLEVHLGANHTWDADGADRKAAKELVGLVEGNPLVLSVAAVLVRQSKRLTWQDLAQNVREHGLEALRPAVKIHPGGMAKHMTLLRQWLCSFLDQDDQQFLAALTMFAGSFTAAGAAAVTGSDEPGESLDLLAYASLIREHRSSSYEQRYSMHAVVRDAAARMLGGPDVWAPPKQHPSLAFTNWMLLHQAGPGQQLLLCAPDGSAPDVLLRLYLLGEELLNFGAAGAALAAAAVQRETGYLERLLGVMCHVGGVLSENGHGYAARQLHDSAAAASARELGADHRQTLTCKAWLADTLQRMGELWKARRLQEEVLQRRARVLGPEHPDVLTIKNGLANTLSSMGELGEARRLQQEVLECRTRVLGPEHPDTLRGKGSLASTLRGMGDLEEARRLQEEVLEASSRVLGHEHPDTLRAKGNLASTLRGVGELDGARRVQEEVLEGCTRVLGPEHPDTLAAKGTLGCILRDMGEVQEGRRLQEEALAVLEPLVGPEGPALLEMKHELGVTLLACGEVAGARQLWEEVLEARVRVLGADHPDTLKTRSALAGLEP